MKVVKYSLSSQAPPAGMVNITVRLHLIRMAEWSSRSGLDITHKSFQMKFPSLGP